MRPWSSVSASPEEWMLPTIPTFATEICRCWITYLSIHGSVLARALWTRSGCVFPLVRRQIDAVAGEGERNSAEKGGGACPLCVRKKHAVRDCQGI